MTPNSDPDRRLRDIVETARLELEEHLESARLRGSREQIGSIKHIYVLESPGMQMVQLPPTPVKSSASPPLARGACGEEVLLEPAH